MNADEEKLLKLRNELYEEWINYRVNAVEDSRTLMNKLYLYMNQLEYVLHGPRGHPDFRF